MDLQVVEELDADLAAEARGHLWGLLTCELRRLYRGLVLLLPLLPRLGLALRDVGLRHDNALPPPVIIPEL